MAFGVFIHRADSIYDDRPAEQYQFPGQYLSRAREFVGDWIVYLEPTKVRRTRGYYAAARVQQIVPDLKADGMHLAIIEPGSYLEFANYVPFSEAGIPLERGVLNEEGRISGRAQSSVRPITAEDFNRIIERGLDDDAPLLPRVSDATPGFEEAQAPIILEQPRQRIQALNSRIERDRVFRKIVLRAYGERCAVTGLRLINGGGRAEVAAAHIKPVEKFGPDLVANGIALSGTAHWMFDRGLIGLADDNKILVSRHVNDIEAVRSIINRSGFAIAPADARDRPHPHFLNWHRENVFKG